MPLSTFVNKQAPSAGRQKGLVCSGLSAVLGSFLLDLGFLTCEVSEVEDSGSSHFSSLVHFDFLNGRQVDREDSFHPNGS